MLIIIEVPSFLDGEEPSGNPAYRRGVLRRLAEQELGLDLIARASYIVVNGLTVKHRHHPLVDPSDPSVA